MLLQPRQLLGQHDDERDLDDLRWLHLNGQERKLQPRPVARAALDAQGRGQQQYKAEAQQEYPFPVFHQLVQVDLRHQQIQHHADDQRGRLHQHQPFGVHIVGGAVDHHDAEQRRDAAQCQQHQVCLTGHIGKQVAYTAQHGVTSPFVKST